jgi:tRNA pseudouridine38-40 synthase
VRYKITLEYDGTGLVGWQKQDNGLSVQGLLEKAASFLNSKPVQIYAAGRTDAGVHALGQVAHLDLEKSLSPDQVRDGLNFWLRHTKDDPKIIKLSHSHCPITLLSAEIVSNDFHARFSALGRAYIYRIINRQAPLALESHRAWHVQRPLDCQAMEMAASYLLGHHDFSSFRAADCQSASPIKTLDQISIQKKNEEIIIKTKARSFLHHQVRNMVGSLKLVGEGKWSPEKLKDVLESCNRNKAGPTAPAHGLYFSEAFY